MARASSRYQRMDQPRDRSRTIRPDYDPELFGRLSERVARFIGSARFIGWMTVFVIVWVLWNTMAPDDLRFDDFPFIFLTLMLSLQASYAAPLILLAQNRQADRDRVQYQEDRTLTERLVADTEYLTREIATIRIATGDLATRDFLRGEVRDLADELTLLLAGEAELGATQGATHTAQGATPATAQGAAQGATHLAAHPTEQGPGPGGRLAEHRPTGPDRTDPAGA